MGSTVDTASRPPSQLHPHQVSTPASLYRGHSYPRVLGPWAPTARERPGHGPGGASPAQPGVCFRPLLGAKHQACRSERCAGSLHPARGREEHERSGESPMEVDRKELDLVSPTGLSKDVRLRVRAWGSAGWGAGEMDSGSPGAIKGPCTLESGRGGHGLGCGERGSWLDLAGPPSWVHRAMLPTAESTLGPRERAQGAGEGRGASSGAGAGARKGFRGRPSNLEAGPLGRGRRRGSGFPTPGLEQRPRPSWRAPQAPPGLTPQPGPWGTRLQCCRLC